MVLPASLVSSSRTRTLPAPGTRYPYRRIGGHLLNPRFTVIKRYNSLYLEYPVPGKLSESEQNQEAQNAMILVKIV